MIAQAQDGEKLDHTQLKKIKCSVAFYFVHILMGIIHVPWRVKSLQFSSYVDVITLNGVNLGRNLEL